MLARPLAALLVLAAGSAAAAGASLEAGAWKSFRNWSAGCDNARNCTAAADDSDREAALALAITRSGEPTARPIVRFAFHHAADGPRRGAATLSAGGRIVARLRIGVDARRSDGEMVVTSDAARAAILAAVRREKALDVRFDESPGEDQRTRYTISLDGAAAALLWIDERQKRIGTVTALARPGDRPASAVPPVPGLPERPRAVAPEAGDPPPLSAGALARIDALREEGCEEGVRERDKDGKPAVQRLTEGRLLVSVRCVWGGVSTSDSYFIVRDGETPQVERARFPRAYEPLDESPGERTPDFVLPDVFTGALDKGELSSGDGTNGGSFCGERATWIWTGRGFEPAEIRTLLPCGPAFVSVPLHRTR